MNKNRRIDGGILGVCAAAVLAGLLSLQAFAYYNLGSFWKLPYVYYVYQASLSGCVQAYSLNHKTGALAAIGSCVTGASAPKGLVATPNHKWLYAGDNSSIKNAVALFSIDQSTGAITYVAEYSTGGQAGYLALSPDGNFLYVAVQNQTLAGFSINQSTGALTAVSGSPTTAVGTAYYGISIDPSQTHVFVSDNTTPSTVHIFPINSTTGAISAPTNVATSPSENGAYGINVSPNGNYVYLSAQGSGYMVSWSDSSGSLSGQTLTSSGGTTPWFNVFSPSSPYLFSTQNGSNAVAVFSYNSSTGALTAITNSPFTTGASTGPKSIAIDPDNQYLFVSLFTSNQLAEFTISQSTGALSALTTIASGGTSPTDIAVVRMH